MSQLKLRPKNHSAFFQRPAKAGAFRPVRVY